MNIDAVRNLLPGTGVLLALALFGTFAAGVILGHIAPDDRITSFDPSNDIAYRISSSTVTVQDVTIGSVEGTSMVPTFWPDDTLLMQEYRKPGQVQEGDIVLYNDSGSRGTHRVIAAYPSQDRIIVKPDNQDVKQEITYSDIDYVVVGVLWN